jgi:non-ribosomal peptide synthetase component E (peptide arylation enzyme)
MPGRVVSMDTLPKNAVGKIAKKDIVAQLTEGTN